MLSKTVFIVLVTIANGSESKLSLTADVRERDAAPCPESHHSLFIMRIDVLSRRLAVDVVHAGEAAPTRRRVGQGVGSGDDGCGRVT